MLHTVIFISSSGIVLFEKEFINGILKPGQLGGIITAMLKFSIQRTGFPVSYIELSNVSVAIESDDKGRVTCAVFHDSSDGAEFGKLMAKELLFGFVSNYIQELSQESKINSPDLFDDFNGKIAGLIRSATRPVLDSLAEIRGINLVLLNTADQLTYSTVEVDKLAVLANHQALLNVAQDLMAAQNDIPLAITLKSRRTTLFLQRIERSTMVVVYKNSVDANQTQKEIERTAQLLRKVLVMASNLKT
jgi:hypothetical protein